MEENWSRALIVALGGGLGSALRYLIASQLTTRFGTGYPWGTTCVNLVGALVFGVVWSASETSSQAPLLRLFILTGMMGGLTTFSTLAFEVTDALFESACARGVDTHAAAHCGRGNRSVAWIESGAGVAMKQLVARIPRVLVSKLDDRLLEVGALAVDVAPADDAQPEWATLTIYFEASEQAAVRTCLRKRLASLPTSEQQRIVRGFVIEEVDESWQTRWSDGLEPVELVSGLVLVPEGADYEPRSSERVMVLEKSLVFGFGEHPTTLMIAAWLAQRCRNKTVLDVGSGSGVLAFVAAHHGAASVRGIDIDPLSVVAATRNAERNAWQTTCTFDETPVEAIEERFELVLANVDALTLERLAFALARAMAPGAALALTGVLEEQAQAVRDAFVAYHVDLRVCERRDGWVLLTTDPLNA